MERLTPTEQEKLTEFQVITAFPEEQHDKVVRLLRNNFWNLEVALSKYFDGQLEEEAAREPLVEAPPPPPVRQRPQPQSLQDFLDLGSGQSHLHLPPLPIVRPITNKWRSLGLNHDHFGLQSFAQSPLLFLLLLIPRTLTFILTGVSYIFDYLFPRSPDTIPSTPTLDKFNAIEHYERLTKDHMDLYKGDFNDCFHECKKNSKFMLLIILGDNDTSNNFIKRVLNNSQVSEYIKEEDIVVYMAHAGEPQGFEIARSMRTKAVPSVYLLANVASGPSGVSSMSVVGRLPVKSLNPFMNKLGTEVERYKPELIIKRAEQEELEYSRKIKEMQDRAYEESLIADRIKKQEKELAQIEAKQKQDRINWEKEQRKIFYASLMNKFDNVDNLPKSDYTTIRFKLPTGEGITQKFSKDHTLYQVYSFIDVTLHLKDLDDEQRQELEQLKELTVDEDYKHTFNFELTSPFPKYTVPVDQDKLVKDVNQLWPNGSVMLEYLDDEEEEEEEEEEEDESTSEEES